MQRHCADVSSPYKRKCWTNSGGPLTNSLLWDKYQVPTQSFFIFIRPAPCRHIPVPILPLSVQMWRRQGAYLYMDCTTRESLGTGFLQFIEPGLFKLTKKTSAIVWEFETFRMILVLSPLCYGFSIPSRKIVKLICISQFRIFIVISVSFNPLWYW